jgi:signal transduction histidine kinase
MATSTHADAAPGWPLTSQIWQTRAPADWNAELELMATIAHDMRGPLSTIATSAELLEQDIEIADSIHLVSVIQRQAKRLQQMIQHLTDYTHVETGKVLLHPSTADLGLLVRETVNDFQEFTPSHRLQVELPAQQALIHADVDKLRRILDNLLSNAAKYSPHGSMIQARLRRLKGRAQRLLLEVEDEGPGIPVAMRRKIFSPFVRLAGSNAGEGLGLYIVSCLVKAHGGRVWVKSGAGGGACFCVVLPATVDRRRSRPLSLLGRGPAEFASRPVRSGGRARRGTARASTG